MERTVDILIEISIYSAVITAFILLFRAAFKKRISPKVQYAMWLLLVLRLMLPVTIESGFHVESLLPDRPAPVVQEESILDSPVISEIPAVNMAFVTEVDTVQPSFDIPDDSAPAISQEIPESTVVAVPKVNKPVFNIRWRIAAFWTWVAGAMAFGLWMMIVKLRFYEDMQRHITSVSPRVYAIYDECCAALGVKPLTMWAVDRAISPGIAFFTYPVLLLPASMDGDEEKLRYAFLHELTHKKRRDHYMTTLLTALRIIYWFNPAVHIGFSEMRADMETACDADVIAFVGKEQKRGYLTAILELFSYATRPQLGMSQASSRRMAKQRMKGAFMRERTTFLGRAAALMLAVIMLVGCFTTACQEAPAEGYEGPVPVIGTDDWQSTVVDEINAYSSDTDYFGNTNIKANTIAINPRFFPPGTEFYIDGIGYFAGLDFLHWHGETDTKNMLSIYMDNEKQVHDFDAMYNTKVLYRMPNYEDADSPYSREYAEGMVTSQVINRLSSCSEELLNNVPTDMASNTLYNDVKKLTDTMGLFLKGVSYAEKHQRLHCNVQMVELPCSYELGRVYSAVMFALIPELYDITIGNWSYYEYYGTIYKRTDTVPPESAVGEVIAREDIAAYYAELIMKPLEEYGTSGSGIRELLSTIAKLSGVNGTLSRHIDIDGDGLEDAITVDTDNTADENFDPETAKATLTVKLGRGETITQEIPGWWQNAEYHTADFDADNRTDIALMLWVGGSNYDATNVYVYHMGNSKLTELAKNVITNDAITYDQSKYSALNGENTHWVSGGTVISEGGKSKLRLRQLLDYDPGAGIATAYYTNLVRNGSGWFIESMEIGEAFGEEQVQPDTLQYAPMLPDPIDTLSDMDLLIYSSLTNNSKVYALPRTLTGNDLATEIWDRIMINVNNQYFSSMPYDAAGAAYNVVAVTQDANSNIIDIYTILTYRRYTILNDELSVDGELNCAVIWSYKENENGEIKFSNVYWPIKDSKGRVSYGNREWPEDLQKYTDFSPDSIGRAERLKAIEEQIAISMDNTTKVGSLLGTITSSPKGSSARIDYINEHVGEYAQLCAMGRRAVSRFMPRFEKGYETGLEGQIMAAVFNALLGVDSLNDYENGQAWYDDNRNEMLEYLQTAVQPTPALNSTNPEWQTAERVCAPFSETGKRIDLSYYEVSIDLNGTERTRTMTENNVTPDQFDRIDEEQTLLMVEAAAADAISDDNRLDDLFTQISCASPFETVSNFVQLDHTAYFGADSPVYRLEKMTSVMDIAEPGWNDTAYTTYFAYLTPQWDYRGQTQSQNIVLGFRFVNAVRGDTGGWKLLQTEADCEKWMDTVKFGSAFASAPVPTPTPETTPSSATIAVAIVDQAKTLVGKPYKKGTYGPDAFDSAGFVYYVLTQEGIDVEKWDKCQGYADYVYWQKIEDKADLQPGDILFFHGDYTEKMQHAGIYTGDGKMIDASSSHGKVIERSWETDYWKEHFAFARRVTSSISTNARKIVSAAQNVIGSSYDEEGYGPYLFCPAGLVYHCLNNSGLYVDRLTCAEYAQLTGYKRIEDRAQLREGDIVFFYDGHGSNRAIRNAGICISEKDMITVGKDSDVHIQTLTNTWAEKNFAHGLRF